MIFINKRKIIIILLSICIFIGVSTSLFLAIKQFKNNKQQTTEQISEDKDKILTGDGTFSKDEKENENDNRTDYEKIQDNLKYDSDGEIASDYTIDNKKGKTLSEIDGKNVITKARDNICNAKWDEAYNIVKNAVNTYNLNTPEGRTISNIYYDTNIVRTLKEIEYNEYPNAFNGFLDPQDLLVAVLHIPEKSRRDIIIDRQSLSPVFDGIVTLKGITGNTDNTNDKDLIKKFKYIQVDNTSAMQLIKIDFSIEHNPLVAYIIRDMDRKLHVYSIESKKGSEKNCLYLTIQQYIDLDKKLYNNSLIRKANAK